MVPRCMSSTVSACIATFFRIRGINYSISSACSTSAHCIAAGADAIRSGSQDIVFAGGGEELHWTLSVLFDAMGAMSSKYNDTPELASRPYVTVYYWSLMSEVSNIQPYSFESIFLHLFNTLW